MKKKTTLLKSLLMTILMVIGATSVSAYTPALTAEYAVAGYKNKAFYNIANENANDMLPTAGDLRFRGSGYGLFNYGSGNRGADITISVANTDLVIFEFKDSQNRSVSINSVSNCTANATVTSGDFKAYDVTADATSLNINIGRGGCIIAILVMEKDNSVETADYTISYKLGEETIKETSGNTAVGGYVPTDASFFKDDVKYMRADGQPEGFNIVSGTNNYTVIVRLAATFSYTLTDNLNGTVLNGTGFEGEEAYLPYSRYQTVKGKLYEAGKTGNEYRKKITLSADNMTESVNYAATTGIAKAEFFSEGESIEGMTVSTKGNIPVRASGASAGETKEDIVITTLPAGTYKLHVGTFTSKSSEQKIYLGYGETQIAFASSGNLNEMASEEFTLSESTEIKYFGTTSSGDAQLDYLWIENLSYAPVAITHECRLATFCSDKALDFSAVEGLTAYIVTSTEVFAQLAKVTKVPAGTGVILEGDPKTYEVPVIATADAIEGNLLIAATTNHNAVKGDYVLAYKDNTRGFFPAGDGLMIPAGKAYLHIDTEGDAPAFLPFAAETTGIGATLVNSEVVKNEVFNLAGQRVAQPTKGLYIVGGRKVVVK